MTGIVREAALAARLGASADADVAVFVLTFPDLLTTVLVAGSVTALLVPRFRALLLEDVRAAGALLRDAQIVVFAGGAAAAAVIWIVADPLVRVLAPGFGSAQRDIAGPLIAVAGLAIPVAAVTAVTTSYLQARGRFALAASGTLLFNATLVIAIVGYVRPGLLAPLAAAVVLGALARWVPQAVQAARLAGAGGGVRIRDRLQGIGRIRRAYVEALGGTTAVILLPFIARALASLGSPGDLALVNYAMRIIDLPLSAFVAVGYAAVLPHLSDLFARGDLEGSRRSLRSLLVATALVTLPITLALFWSAGPVAQVLYARAAMDAESAARIGRLAAIGLLSLPAQGAMAVLTAAFVARRSLGYPLVASAAALVLLAVLGVALAPALGTVGLMTAYLVVHWALAAAYALRLRAERLDLLGGGVPRDIAFAFAATVAGFVPAALVGDALRAGAVPTFAVGLLGGGMSLGLVLLVPYRNVPAGIAGMRRLLSTVR